MESKKKAVGEGLHGHLVKNSGWGSAFEIIHAKMKIRCLTEYFLVQGKTFSVEIEPVPGVRRFCWTQAAGYCPRETKCRVARGRATFKCSLVSQGMNTQPY